KVRRKEAPQRDARTRCQDAPPDPFACALASLRTHRRRHGTSPGTLAVMLPTLRLRVLLLSATVLLSACSGGVAAASFEPGSACTSDGRFAGAYPDLEALVPGAYRGDAPQTLDSGRICTAAGLGSLAADGVKEVRFAGETWTFG